ncbi:MAG: hypothetical protein KDE47_00325, partial [Caldilineaceae bacterium]|nr:hypothetical protein [Caldilineaceae bacterium]
MTHVDIKRTVERLHPCIGHGVGPVERNLVPAERFFWWLMARHVMGRDTGFVVVGGRIPRLMIERFCLVNIASKLRLCPRRAKLNHRIMRVHRCLPFISKRTLPTPGPALLAQCHDPGRPCCG